jgi:hypothetical protein
MAMIAAASVEPGGWACTSCTAARRTAAAGPARRIAIAAAAVFIQQGRDIDGITMQAVEAACACRAAAAAAGRAGAHRSRSSSRFFIDKPPTLCRGVKVRRHRAFGPDS